MLTVPFDCVRDILLPFCQTGEVRALRRSCKRFRDRIPREWTADFVYISDQLPPQREYNHHDALYYRIGEQSLRMTYAAFVSRPRYFPVLERLMWVDNPHVHELVLETPCNVHDLTIIRAKRLERVVVGARNANVREVMLFHAPALRTLDISAACTALKSLFLSNLDLVHLEFSPSWSRLKTIVLSRTGHLPHLVIPETYTQLEFLQITEVGLEVLELRQNVERDRLVLSVQEPRAIVVRVPHDPEHKRIWCSARSRVTWVTQITT